MRFAVPALAMRNLVRRPRRTAALGLGIAVLAFMVYVLAGLYWAGSQGLARGIARMGADAVVLPGGTQAAGATLLVAAGPTGLSMDGGTAEAVARDPLVERSAPQLFIVSARLACCSVSDTALIGFDPERDFTVGPWLRKRLGRPVKNDEIIVGANILNEPGGKIQFYQKLFTVAGKLDPTGLEVIDGSVFIPLNGVREMVAAYESEVTETGLPALRLDPEGISALMVKFMPGTLAGEAAMILEYRHPGVTVIPAAELMRVARRTMHAPLAAAAAVVAAEICATVAITGALFGVLVAGRRREFGIMRALGARRGDVVLMLFYESLATSAAGGLAGGALGMLALSVGRSALSQLLSVPLDGLSAHQAVLVLALTIGVACASGAASAAYTLLRASGSASRTALPSE